MIYLKIKKYGKLYKLYMDYDYLGTLYKSDFKTLGIKISPESEFDIEVEDSVWGKIRDMVTDRAYEKGVSYLVDSERCSEDIKLRLRKKDFPDYAIEEAVQVMYDQNYLSDERFASSYTRSYMRIKSRSLIERELEMRHISVYNLSDVIKQVYEDEGFSEDDALSALIEKKLAGADIEDEKVKRKLVSFLLRHGFSFEQINNHLT